MDAADPPAVPVTLAIPINGSTPTGGATLEIAGQRWLLTDYSDAAHAPGYTCISYSWGTARTAHPCSPEVLISARAPAVIEATCKAVQQTAIWLDALCIPFGDAERPATLRSMGAIHARAAQVVVVLSPECASAIGEIAATRKLSEVSLGGLEHDLWVTRAWTYQECANSAAVRFCVEGGGTASVVGDDLLNALGQALSDYRKTHGVGSFELSKLLPGLDGLESTLADWMLSGTAERMAYQVMVGVELRSPGMSAKDRLTR